MGIIVENCVNCCKNEKEKEKEDKSNINERAIEPVKLKLTTTQKTIVSETTVGDENCKGIISIIIDDKKVDDSKEKKKKKFLHQVYFYLLVFSIKTLLYHMIYFRIFFQIIKI